MKQITLKTISLLTMIGMMAACGSVVSAHSSPQSEARAVAVTSAPELVVSAPVEMAPKNEPAVTVKLALATQEELEAGFETGSTFHLTDEGDLQLLSENSAIGADTGDNQEALTVGNNSTAEEVGNAGPVEQAEENVVHLNSATQAANLRRGPGFSYEVIRVIQSGDDALTVLGRTVDGWLKVTHHGDEGWIAANLVEVGTLLATLPVINPPAAAAPTPAPTAAPVVAAPQLLACFETPIRGFGKVWGNHPEVKMGLNCPSQMQEQGTNAAIQQFQHGIMLWLESDTVYSADPVYVFFNDGTYQRFGDHGPADPAKTEKMPEGVFEVGEKFGKAYWEGTGARVKERLGYPTGPAIDSPGAFQQFYNGRMFWAGTIDKIFVIYDYYDYTNNQTIHITGWELYDDTF